MRRLTDEQVQRAAALLLSARSGMDIGPDLPEELIPESTADIQRIIDTTSAGLDRPVRGWKIYTVYKPMNPPFFAPIYELFENGATIPANLSPLRLIEPEIMFRADRDFPTSDRQYDIDEIRSGVTAHVGYEVIGGRFRTPTLEAMYSLSKGKTSHYGSLSDHIANACVILGDAISAWREVAFEQTPLLMTEDGREVISFVGGHPFDNPFLPIVMGINRLRRGPGVRRGDVLISSSSTSFFSVKANSLVRTVYEGLGAVEARFAID